MPAPLAVAVPVVPVGVVPACAVACPSWLLFAPVVPAVVFRVAAVPPLLVVFESDPDVPAPLAVVEADPPIPVEVPAAELCVCAPEPVVPVEDPAVSVRLRLASADAAEPVEVDCDERD